MSTRQLHSFEQTMQDLENCVTAMEQDTLTLAERVSTYQQAIKLHKRAETLLSQAAKACDLSLTETPSSNDASSED